MNLEQTNMKWLILVILCNLIMINSGVLLNKFKRVHLQGQQWSKFINISSLEIKSIIECGALCSAHKYEACDAYALIKSDQICHVGFFDNSQVNFLTDQTGDQPVYVNLGKLLEQFQKLYHIITQINDVQIWQQYIYGSKTMDAEHDHVDCSFICTNVEAPNCDLFAFNDQVCYLGKSTQSNGEMIELNDATLYLTQSSLETITSTFGTKTGVNAKHWKKFIEEDRTDIGSSLDCAGLAQLENWHYASYSSESQTCSLALIDHETEAPETSGADQDISINLNLLSEFQEQVFVVKSSSYFAPFIYQVFGGTKNVHHCSIHCYFDASDHCDFHYLVNDQCYLGNFNTENPVGSSGGTYNMYIFQDNVHDMNAKLYPTTALIEKTQWSKHIRETIQVVSLQECAAHATLYSGAPIDFYVFLEDSTCHLGDLAHVIGGENDPTEAEIRIRQTNTLDHTNAVYDARFNLPGSIWSKFIFDTYDLASPGNAADCGARCQLHSAQCDFFVYTTSKCYFGIYSQTDGTFVSESFEALNYHKSGLINNFGNPLYWTWHDNTVHWARYVYSRPSTDHIGGCFMRCKFDDNCDFFVHWSNQCCLGKMTHSGSQFTGDNYKVYFKIGHENAAFVSSYFNNQNGNLIHWPYWAVNIYHTNTDDESRCAKRCLTSHDWDTCNYYVMANGRCQLGRFNYRGNQRYGDFSDSTVLKMKNSINIPALMQRQLPGTNNGGCENYGYKVLSSGSFWIQSAGYPSYGNDQRCYWSIYAPGANGIRIVMEDFITHDANDRFYLFVGTGGGSYHFWDLYGNRGPQDVSIASEMITIHWYTNCCDHNKGWRAQIIRY